MVASQTLRRWTEDATYIRQGDHQVGHWPTFLVHITAHKVPHRSYSKRAHWRHQLWCTGTRPLDFQQFDFFQLTLQLHNVWQRLCVVASPNILYSAAAAAVVQSRLNEPCPVYYFASFYMRQNFHVVLCPPRTRSSRRHWIYKYLMDVHLDWFYRFHFKNRWSRNEANSREAWEDDLKYRMGGIFGTEYATQYGKQLNRCCIVWI